MFESRKIKSFSRGVNPFENAKVSLLSNYDYFTICAKLNITQSKQVFLLLLFIYRLLLLLCNAVCYRCVDSGAQHRAHNSSRDVYVSS